MRGNREEERLRAELEEHLALQTAENVRAGFSPAEARRRAVLKFGAVEAAKESYRDQRGLPFLETLMRDTRLALRGLRKAPAFTSAAVLTLALGIGATTSIFTLVHAVILKSLAVANPSELYRLGKETHCCYHGGYSQDHEFSLISYELYKYFRNNTKGFSEFAAFQASPSLFGVRRKGVAEAARSYPGEFVSGNYFLTFGVGAYVGRALVASDETLDARPVAVMSYRLWRQRYGSDPSVVGSVFDLNDKPFTVVGIAPPGFFGDTLRATPPDFYLPLTTEPYTWDDADLANPSLHWFDAIGRIRPGANVAQVEAAMRVELKQWLRSHWGEMSPADRINFPAQTLYLSPGGAGITSMREEYEHWLQILMIVSGSVLLIVCANVANLLLVRGLERRRQTSLSMALGAQPARLVRQALTESILIALVGGTAGVVIAFAGTRLILRFAFPPAAGMPEIPISAGPSLPVLLFAFGISLLTGLVFGIAPAWIATRVDPMEALRGAGRSTAHAGSLGRKSLVVFQAALALVLLSAAGLLTNTLHKLEHQDFGFDQDHRLVVHISPTLAGYRVDQLSPLYRRIRDSLAAIPGISAVALATYSPQNGNAWGDGVWVAEHAPPGPRDDTSAFKDRVTGGFFDVVGNPILQGRAISEQDTANGRRVAVINQALARKFFKGEDPIGKHFRRSEKLSAPLYEVIGVAKDARYLTLNLDKPVAPMFFLPEAASSPSALAEGDPSSNILHDVVILTRPDASITPSQVDRAIAAVDPNLAVISIQPLAEQVAGQFRQQRLIARLTSFFGILSLLLACIGLYGVTAYNVGCRVNEFGVRMALGADRSDAFVLVLRGAFGLILFGLVIGLPMMFAGGRLLGHQLYGTNPYDPLVAVISVAALGLSAVAASFLPAWRASSISPLEALRAE